MAKIVSKINSTSEKKFLLLSGMGVAVNLLLTLFIVFGLKPSSEVATLVAVLSLTVMIIGLFTAVLSIIAIVKISLILKVIPMLFIIITIGLTLLAYFNIWWFGY